MGAFGLKDEETPRKNRRETIMLFLRISVWKGDDDDERGD